MPTPDKPPHQSRWPSRFSAIEEEDYRPPIPQISRLGDFTLTSVLARGPRSIVFNARDPRGNRCVIKLARYAQGMWAERLRWEFDLLRTLAHPAIVPVLDVGRTEEYAWLALPWIPGGESTQLIPARRRRPDIARILAVGRDVAGALDFAHAHGVIHRDVKPTNILLTGVPVPHNHTTALLRRPRLSGTRGLDARPSSAPPDSPAPTPTAMLTDFGIADVVDAVLSAKRGAAPPPSNLGTVVLSVPYAAPEQWRNVTLTGKVDQYALGCTLVELLSGAQLFKRATTYGVAEAHAKAERPDLWLHYRWFTRRAGAAIVRAVSIDPHDRFDSCADFVAELAAGFGYA